MCECTATHLMSKQHDNQLKRALTTVVLGLKLIVNTILPKEVQSTIMVDGCGKFWHRVTLHYNNSLWKQRCPSDISISLQRI